MRRLVLYVAASLDGFIARESGEVDWLFTDQDYGYREFITGVGTVLMGRKTYDLARTFAQYPFKGMESFVFSRAVRGRDEDAVFVNGDPAPFISDLKQKPGKSIWLVGGGEIASECVRHDLIDDFVLSLHPVLLGRGVPLFGAGLPERTLHFERSESFSSGLVQLFYVRESGQGS